MNERRPIGEYSIRELREVCQSTAPNPARESKVGLFTRIFSIYFTKLFLYTPITPNQITAISVLVFFSGMFSFFFSSMTAQLVGVFFVFFSIVLDGCDGETARFRQVRSRIGGRYTEPVSHDIQYGLGFFIFGIAFYVLTGSVTPIILGATASIFKLLYRFLEIRYWNISHSKHPTKEKVEKIKKEYTTFPVQVRAFYWLNKNIFSQNGNLLILFILVLVQYPMGYLWFFSVGYGLLWFILFLKQIYTITTKPHVFPASNIVDGPSQSE